jgi:hypothetical protein
MSSTLPQSYALFLKPTLSRDEEASASIKSSGLRYTSETRHGIITANRYSIARRRVA